MQERSYLRTTEADFTMMNKKCLNKAINQKKEQGGWPWLFNRFKCQPKLSWNGSNVVENVSLSTRTSTLNCDISIPIFKYAFVTMSGQYD